MAPGIALALTRMTPRFDGEIIEGRYHVESQIGQGGMSVVLLARDNRLKKQVAIKMLLPHLTIHEQSMLRFQQEAEAASHLDHPHIVKILDFGADEQGLPYMVMDYIRGQSLAAAIKTEGWLEPNRALNIFVQIASALSHAHENGVIHRDLKPSNVILSEHDGQVDVVKLVDFGIAKLLRQDGEDQARLTQTGEVFGSPFYMSPEQCMGEKLDARSDVYSLGCLMYEALTGQPPHAGTSTLEILHKHISKSPEPFKAVAPDNQVPEQLEALVFKCMARDKNDRYSDMREIKNELSRLYMERTNNPFLLLKARAQMLWFQRRKLSKREKLAYGLLCASLLGLSALSIYIFCLYSMAQESPWAESEIRWIDEKIPVKQVDRKYQQRCGVLDKRVNSADQAIEIGLNTPIGIIHELEDDALAVIEYGG
ncbi:MAG TPA: serine/threonine-protein kinase, partial [Candidatus Obscuribacterales bacterium]